MAFATSDSILDIVHPAFFLLWRVNRRGEGQEGAGVLAVQGCHITTVCHPGAVFIPQDTI